jgi:hypothetical protein
MVRIKTVLLATLLTSLSVTLYGQSLSTEIDSETVSYASNQFGVGSSVLTLSGNQVDLKGPDRSVEISRADAFSWSANGQYFGVIHLNDQLVLTLFDGKADRTREIELEHFDPMDETLGMWMFNDGRVLTRDNVVNFTMFKPDGKVDYTISNSSGSGSGETLSRAVTDPFGHTVVLYIPRIDYGESEGSLARIIFDEEDRKELYSSRDREIVNAGVSPDARFVHFLTRSSGTEDQVSIKDRFGNEIAQLESEIGELRGASLSRGAGHLTVWSSGRVQVYQLPELERIGSASVQQSVIYADYHKEESQIVILGGRESNGEVNQPEMQIVDINRRAIARSEVEGELSIEPARHLSIRRVEANRYQLKGMNRVLFVTGQF